MIGEPPSTAGGNQPTSSVELVAIDVPTSLGTPGAATSAVVRPAAPRTTRPEALSPLRPDTSAGTELDTKVLLPSWPRLPTPQHFTLPFTMSAHERKVPVLTLTAVDEGDAPSIPDTATGTSRSVVELSPTLPKRLVPQHFTLPSAITAHVCKPAALTLTANDDGDSPSIFDTSTGTLVGVVVPSPN